MTTPYAHRPPLIAAIDPDVERSGLAILHPSTQSLSLHALPLPQLIAQLREQHHSCPQMLVIVEASWQSSHNWHLNPRESRAVSARKGYQVGRNHQVGHDIIALLAHYGIAHREVPPLRKMWSSPEGKASHQELARYLPLPPRTNQEMRDAALLAWHYAALPLRTANNRTPTPPLPHEQKP